MSCMDCSRAEEVSCDNKDKRVSSSFSDLSRVGRSGKEPPATLLPFVRPFVESFDKGMRELMKSGMEDVESSEEASVEMEKSCSDSSSVVGVPKSTSEAVLSVRIGGG